MVQGGAAARPCLPCGLSRAMSDIRLDCCREESVCVTGAKARCHGSTAMAKKRNDDNGPRGTAGPTAGEPKLDRVAKAAKRSRGELEPALSVAIRLARAEIEECALILKHAEGFADGGRFKAANERVLDVEPKLFEVQHLLNAATLLNRRMKELADRD
jgi:hypothetical protein